ncbi:hypothetical protein GGF47_003173, partial [Coemansia sp. RSA 2524]
ATRSKLLHNLRAWPTVLISRTAMLRARRSCCALLRRRLNLRHLWMKSLAVDGRQMRVSLLSTIRCSSVNTVRS